MKGKVLLGLLFGVLVISGCEAFNTVRYDCYAYENWNRSECQKPQCKVFDYCTEDLFDAETWKQIQESMNSAVPEATEVPQNP